MLNVPKAHLKISNTPYPFSCTKHHDGNVIFAFKGQSVLQRYLAQSRHHDPTHIATIPVATISRLVVLTTIIGSTRTNHTIISKNNRNNYIALVAIEEIIALELIVNLTVLSRVLIILVLVTCYDIPGKIYRL